MSKIFQFKQFSVDQSDCGMKVNTDAALIGALAGTDNPKMILEIGTGTGVIALMIAQRYPDAIVDAVEIDEKAGLTASKNFSDSAFADRITLHNTSFEDYFLNTPGTKYDLIVSNPPYFINSLKSDDDSKMLAKHTDVDFFENLINGAQEHLSDEGVLFLILPLDTGSLATSLAEKGGKLKLQKTILIHSFPDTKPYRCRLVFGLGDKQPETQKFVIYEKQNTYTDEYRDLLKNYLTIF